MVWTFTLFGILQVGLVSGLRLPLVNPLAITNGSTFVHPTTTQTSQPPPKQHQITANQ